MLPHFILGSSSIARKRLLKKLGFRFRVVAPKVREVFFADSKKTVLKNAIKKVRSIDKTHKFSIPIVCCDTIVYYNGKLIGKPRNQKEAFQTLTLLSGKWHYVYSGIAVVTNGKIYSGVSKTRVKLKKLSEKEIEKESRTKHVLKRAGAYAIQNRYNTIEKYKGRYDTIVGIDVSMLRKFLSI